MRAINHALTGSIIGLTVAQPAIAIPAAIVSHLVCDAIPHYGGKKDDIVSTKFKLFLVVDALLCGLLVLYLFASGSSSWILASICAFAAAAPDFLSIRKFVYALKGKPLKQNLVERFLRDIQWFERPIGAVVEVAWFAVTLTFVATLA